MAHETQLDIHEIDKLLADDDFIDDFDFSEDDSDQFVDAEGFDEGESEIEIEFDHDGPAIEEASVEGDSDGAGVVGAQDVIANVALEFDDLEFDSHGTGKDSTRVLKIVVGLVAILWLAQLFGVLYILKQPVIIRDEIRPLTAAIDLSLPPQSGSETAADLSEDMVVAVNSLEPDIFLFTLYLPLYSLDGLKVFSTEIEIVQFQKSGRLAAVGQKKLQESLRFLLQEAIGERLREEIVDVRGYLTAMVTPHIENFFSDRQIDLEKVKIIIINSSVQ